MFDTIVQNVDRKPRVSWRGPAASKYCPVEILCPYVIVRCADPRGLRIPFAEEARGVFKNAAEVHRLALS